MLMTPTQFVEQYIGRVIDWDGVYGVQCVDGFKVFCQWAGIPNKPTPNGWADSIYTCLNADGTVNQAYKEWQETYFTKVSPDRIRNGDICVWGKGSSCSKSHVAMLYNGEYFGENQGGDRGFRLVSLKNDILGGLRWKGFEMIGLNNGFQEVTYNGQTILAYKQYGDQEIGMVSAGADGHTVKPIELIDDDHIHFCKVNASYFQMSKTSSDPYGTPYGVIQSFNYSQEPKQGKFYVYAVLNDGTIKVCMDSEYWLTKSDVKFAVSPAVIMLYCGTETEMISPAIGRSKVTTSNHQTLLLRLEDGSFVLAIVKGKLNLYDCRAWSKSVGALDMIALDGGGSSQMHWSSGLYSTGRAIPNVLTIYTSSQDVSEPTEDEKPKEEENIVDNEKPSEMPVLPSEGYLFKMSDKTYDGLLFLYNLIPLFLVLYVALAKAWNIPYTDNVVATISAFGVFLNSVLKQSSIGYERSKK